MKTLLLDRDYCEASRGLKGRHPARSHFDQTIDTDTIVVTPYGKIIALFLKQQIIPDLWKPAYKDWKVVNDLLDNRATAVGTKSLRHVRNDGSLGRRNGVANNVLQVIPEARQGILGYLDDPCREAALSESRPELLYKHVFLIARVDRLYERYVPTVHAKQRAEIERALFWCRLWDTAFSTIYLLKNFSTRYHVDTGNFEGVMTALMAMGDFSGGELVLPRWRIAFALTPGDLLFFDPQNLHGNLPFEGERLSAAFYCERRIAECGKKRRHSR